MKRPRTRSECGTQRPCPWVSCRHHLYLDVTEAGTLKLNHPDLEPDELVHSCSLDVKPDVDLTLTEVGRRLGVVREQARLIELSAITKLRVIAETGKTPEPPELKHAGARRKDVASKKTLNMRRYRDENRRLGVCVNGRKHGPVVSGGRCQSCIDIDLQRKRAA